MPLGFHCGPLVYHHPVDAIEHLAGVGFRVVAVRPRLNWCNPSSPDFHDNIQQLVKLADQRGMRIIFDSECPFLVNPSVFEPPAMIQRGPDQDRWLGFLTAWIDALGSADTGVLTLPSGPGDPSASNLDRLAETLDSLSTLAAKRGVQIAIRPAVGHVIDSLPRFERLRKWVNGPIALAADVGEMLGSHELPIVARLEHHRESLAVVYVCCPGDGGSVPAGRPASGAGRTDRLPGHGELDFDRLIGSITGALPEVPAVVRFEHHGGLGLRPAVGLKVG